MLLFEKGRKEKKKRRWWGMCMAYAGPAILGLALLTKARFPNA
jgi:hypothetical protein